jgi:hypothetical protein
VVILKPSYYSEAHMPVKKLLASKMLPALAAIDTVEDGTTVPIDVPAALFARRAREERTEERSRRRIRWVRRIRGSLAFRAFRAVTHPLLKPLTPLLTRAGHRPK